jgi:hypothetical protein
VPKPIKLSNGREFPTQKAALEHFKQMLHRYGDGAVIDDAQDHEDLVALLERYDLAITDGPPKTGPGIDHFERRLNTAEGWTTPGFWVVQTTGQATDFSFYTAVKGQPKSDAQQFTDACRTAVQPDMVAAKDRFFAEHGDAEGRVICELTQTPISRDEAHLDHAWPPFLQLVMGFRAARGWGHAVPDGVITAPDQAQVASRFINPADTQAFIAYHHQIAQLRMVAKKANLSMAARQRRPKIQRPVRLV